MSPPASSRRVRHHASLHLSFSPPLPVDIRPAYIAERERERATHISSPSRSPLAARSPTSNNQARKHLLFSEFSPSVVATTGGMQSSSSACGGSGVAPFVAKTYGMVDDRATDAVVAWGPAGNSFVVADPFAFSRGLLPAHFKHANFSSFVRQLNTYGFRKVDPDRWEFAHASFLRGQTHLLRHIVRRQSSSSKRGKDGKEDLEDDEESSSEMLAMEVVRLRNEQRVTEERVAAMWSRVQDAERRPKLMLAFLLKVVGDPDVLRRLAGSSGSGPGEGAEVKRPRLLLDRESVDGAGVDGLLYHHSGNLSPEEALVPEPSVDLYYAGGNGFGGVQMDGSPPYGFHMDNGY